MHSSIRASALIVFLLFFPGNGWAGELPPKYVGSEGCQCHKSEINDWNRSKHAKAFDLLLPGRRKLAKKAAGLNPDRDYSRDRKCIHCHVVGYRKGGFVDMDTTPQFAGVGCESCHGAGGDYRVLHGKKPRTFTKAEATALGQHYGSLDESVCMRCHENGESPFKRKVNEKYRFNHATRLSKTKAFHQYYPLKSKH